jgi:O-antigen ligase
VSTAVAAPANTRRVSLLVCAALVYLGAESMLPRYLSFRAGFLASLLVAAAIALLGWRHIPRSRSMRLYLGSAVVASAWFGVSSIAAWSPDSVYGAMTVSVWLVFIIPGLAATLSERAYLHALVTGFCVGIAVYGVVVASRVVTGASVVDVTGSGVIGLILGRNRNLVSMSVLMGAALLLAAAGPKPLLRLRWVFLALSVMVIIYGGGRSGLIGLAMFALLYALLQPSGTRKTRWLLMLGVVALLFVSFGQSSGGPIRESTDRLLSLVQGERTPSDDARELDNRKAWNIGLDHPVFGVGYGNYTSTRHPVEETAPSMDVRRKFETLTSHNTYALVLAETGFPGVAVFLFLLGGLFVSGAHNTRDSRVRVAAAGFGALAVMMFVDAVLGTVIFYPMAMVLAVACTSEGSGDLTGASTSRLSTSPRRVRGASPDVRTA